MTQDKNTFHPWKIIEKEYKTEDLGLYGSIFSLANGYIGIRASHEDSLSPDRPKPTA